MPHRTIFQWGKNHAHPFTMFIGGLVIGALVTGAIAYAWVLANDTSVEFQNALSGKRPSPSAKASASPSPTVAPSASPSVSF